MIVKPDFSLVGTECARLTQAYQSVQSLMSAEPRITEDLQKSAYACYRKAREAELKKISVDTLAFASHDVPVEALKAAGLTDCAQLDKVTRAQLESIPGVDGKGIQKIFNALSDARKAAEKKTSIRLSIDHPDADQNALVTALHRYIGLKNVFTEGRRLLGENAECVQKYIPDAQKITSGTRWFFSSSQDKQTVSDAAMAVYRAASGDLIPQSVQLQQTYSRVMSADTAGARKAFSQNTAAYYAALETWLDRAAEEAKRSGRQVQIPRQSASSELLPSEIVDQVEEVVLDTSGLKATLRNYQNFGTKYMLSQKRVLLGDEMGLGKTMQAIGAMAHLQAQGASRFLVVSPASVLMNWTREVQKFSGLQTWLLHGLDFADNLIGWYNKGGLAVTNFESVRKILDAAIDDMKLDMIVVDEAHFIKNPQARRTVNVKTLADKAEYAVFMTGTPLENNVQEMQNLIGMLQGSLKNRLSEKAETFEKQACSLYLRRTRSDVLKELPEKTETSEWCTLGSAEKKAYRKQVAAGNFMGMRQVSWDVADLKDSSKAVRLQELVQEAVEDHRKVLVFSFFLDTLKKVKELFGEAAAGPISGSVDADERQKIIDDFSASATQNVLVCQSVSGGTGLNIQSASVVIFCEPQIKPSIETQAIARAYRMGQAHDVLVYRLLADDTVDERIMEILSDKQLIFDTYAEKSLVGAEDLKRLKDEIFSGSSEGASSGTSSEKDASQHQNEIIAAERQRIAAEESAEKQKDGTSGEESASDIKQDTEEDTASDSVPETNGDTRKQEDSTGRAAAAGTDVQKEAETVSSVRSARKTKAQRTAERYPDGDCIPMGTYTVGETLLSGEYFIRVQDSREKSAVCQVFASETDRENGKASESWEVPEVRKITLKDGEVVTLERADLVKALKKEG